MEGQREAQEASTTAQAPKICCCRPLALCVTVSMIRGQAIVVQRRQRYNKRIKEQLRKESGRKSDKETNDVRLSNTAPIREG